MSDKLTCGGLTDGNHVHDDMPLLSTPDASECTSISSASPDRSSQADSEESSDCSLPILDMSSPVLSSYEDVMDWEDKQFNDTSEMTTQSVHGYYASSEDWIDSGYSTSILESTASSKSREKTD